MPPTVTHGVPRTALTAMDTGRKRTGRDAQNLETPGGCVRTAAMEPARKT
ncbi:hypothetical protein GCM10010420_44800 [Streptomyces glaucosporus]|uniref:Uncharacterized protein n=1 Tax=Streptomyces glaucosporus TaxID=284044 RepID=A0ABN3IRR1_9ACTN